MANTLTAPLARSRGTVQPSTSRGRIVLLALVCAQFVAMLDSSILNVALPSVAENLVLTPTGTAWILNAYFLTFGGLLLLSGRAADLFGRRRMFLLGSTVLIASSALAGFATTETLLIAARLLQGLGAAALTPAALSLLLLTFPGEGKARAMSAWGAASALGGATGVAAGGILVAALGWQSVFVLTGAVALVNVVIAARFTAPDPVRVRRPFDFGGAVTVTGAMLALVFAILSAPQSGFVSLEVLGGIGAALLLTLLFVRIERRAAEPVVPLELFRSLNVSAGVAINLLGGAARVACFFLVALYLQQGLGFDPALAGSAMMPTSIAGFAVTLLLLPRVVAKWGATRTMIVGLAIVAVAHLWLARGPVTGNYALDVLPGLLIAASGVALSFTPTTLVITSGVPTARSGMASGIASASAQMGGALGIATFSAIHAAVKLGLHDSGLSAEAATSGFGAAFLAASTTAAAAAILGTVLLRRA
ncbi:MFS transporter [Glaciibacter sp. 2TAF33]|uniref:MFS transporter n=1 Tax=Glaciibacter sp. 2TAF33 TaxID=3233015 RepID=UPI003F8FDE8A